MFVLFAVMFFRAFYGNDLAATFMGCSDFFFKTTDFSGFLCDQEGRLYGADQGFIKFCRKRPLHGNDLFSIKSGILAGLNCFDGGNPGQGKSIRRIFLCFFAQQPQIFCFGDYAGRADFFGYGPGKRMGCVHDGGNRFLRYPLCHFLCVHSPGVDFVAENCRIF